MVKKKKREKANGFVLPFINKNKKKYFSRGLQTFYIQHEFHENLRNENKMYRISQHFHWDISSIFIRLELMSQSKGVKIANIVMQRL